MGVNKFKMFLVKSYYSIKGFLTIYFSKTKFFEAKNISIPTTNVIYKHINGREFLVSTEAMEPSTGVVFFDTKKKKITYWAIGVLNFRGLYKKDVDEIKINKNKII